MKLSIEAEFVYNFANDTQVIANLEASRTSDQLILSNRSTFSPRPKFFPIPPLAVIDGSGLRFRAM